MFVHMAEQTARTRFGAEAFKTGHDGSASLLINIHLVQTGTSDEIGKYSLRCVESVLAALEERIPVHCLDEQDWLCRS